MGADYSAYAVIGHIIDKDEFPVVKKRVKAFKHDFPDDPEVKFHPTTGKQLYEDIEYPKYAFEDEDGETGEAEQVIKLKEGFKLFYGTDDDPIVLGMGTGDETYSNGGENYEFSELKDVSEIKAYVKEILEKIGQWDEKKFGLYSLLYCSY